MKCHVRNKGFIARQSVSDIQQQLADRLLILPLSFQSATNRAQNGTGNEATDTQLPDTPVTQAVRQSLQCRSECCLDFALSGYQMFLGPGRLGQC